MTITIDRMENEPILVMELKGVLTAREITEALVECAQMSENIQGTVFRINDMSKMVLSISELVALVRALRAGVPGSAATNPRIQNIFVGNRQTIRLYTDILTTQVFDGQPMPVFGNMDDALNYIRCERLPESA